jgi:hypothetical protein
MDFSTFICTQWLLCIPHPKMLYMVRCNVIVNLFIWLQTIWGLIMVWCCHRQPSVNTGTGWVRYDNFISSWQSLLSFKYKVPWQRIKVGIDLGYCSPTQSVQTKVPICKNRCFWGEVRHGESSLSIWLWWIFFYEFL